MIEWKDKHCSECDFCVNRLCRNTKPVQGRYPMVVTLGSRGSDTPACSSFKEKTSAKADTVL